MNRYLIYSLSGHFLFFAVLLGGSLWRKPAPVYTIDLISSLPAGNIGGSAGAPAVETAPPRVAPPEPKEVPKDAIKLDDKKKKKPAKPKPEPKQVYKVSPTAKPSKGDTVATDTGDGKGASGDSGGGGGSGIVATAGEGIPFPFPWYLERIVDRLEQQWKPDINLKCQVSFTIRRNGQTDDAKITKSSGDSTFDQQAVRAVIYANPFPPLPPAFPQETLRVHMTLKGS